MEHIDAGVIQSKVKDDDFDVEAELKAPIITKVGDVWTLGRHRLPFFFQPNKIGSCCHR